jgi:acyl-CoA synthetase (AMP-forming)/AMP-acid ligase II
VKLISLLRGDAQQALVARARQYSSADVCAAVADRIHMLGCEGVTRGQRLLVLHDHDEDAIFLLAAASAAGLRLVMPYSLHEATAPEWAAVLRAAQPDHVIDLRAPGYGPRAPAPRAPNVVTRAALLRHGPSPHAGLVVVEAPDPVEEFLTLFTSGTTGAPKAIIVSETLICRRTLSVAAKLDFDAGARVFMTGLLNNTTGTIFTFGAFAHGATLYLPHGRDIAHWPAQVEAQRLTHMMLRPAAMRQFLAAADGCDLSSLQTVAYGAAAMPRPLIEAARRRMPCRWVQGYGLSETFGPFCWMTEEDHRAGLHRAHVHCVGRPDDTLEVRIDASAPGEIGEVLVRGDALMQGYADPATGKPCVTDDWFRTGDFGLFASGGILVLKGRTSGTLLSENGHRIYPEEVEGALAEIEGVAETLLLALPAAIDLGNAPVGCIHGPLAFEEAEAIEASVAAALALTLAREKWPAYIFASREPFPRNDNDKIDRREVARRLADGPLIALAGGG